MARIPKIIHYCWFGGQPYPPLVVQCIESWRRFLPDYEFLIWTEENSEFLDNVYARQAFQTQKWAFLSDYVRVKALADHGGIYLDTDVELVGTLDEFLEHPAFVGLESAAAISTALIGSEKGGGWISMILDDYAHRVFLDADGKPDYTTNVSAITRLTSRSLKLRPKNIMQNLDQLVVYPCEYFSPIDFYTGKLERTSHTRSIHHYSGSWLDPAAHRRLSRQRKVANCLGKRCGFFVNKVIEHLAWRLRAR
jgi:mannosyltransferase OCH1-like enzyme